MQNRRIWIFIVLQFLVLAPTSLASVDSPQTCEKQLEGPREQMLKRLRLIENHFFRMQLFYYKHHELTYRPFWEVHQRYHDPFDHGGESLSILYERYEFQQQNLLQNALQQKSDLENSLEELKGPFFSIDDQCSVWDYQDCVSRWRDKTREVLEALEKIIQKYAAEEAQFTEEIEIRIDENPSEHHDFGSRYQKQFVRWQTQVYPEFLHRLRQLQEFLEFHWPGQSCCVHCTLERIAHAESALDQVLVADPEASFGVRGNVVGGANLDEAFEDIIEIDDLYESEE